MSSPDRPVLKVAPCSHAAAKYAVENWHYSRSLPAGKLFKMGAWEGDKYVGCVLFSYGANHNIGKPYGLIQTEVCELVRVALRSHQWPVSRIMRFALKELKQNNPGMRLVVSYADTAEGHHGVIYQATGWSYVGSIMQASTAEKDGRISHKRTFDAAGIKGYKLMPPNPKHKYLMPLDEDMKRKIEPLRKPYPKRAGSIAGDAPDFQSGEGGSIPTPALKNPVPTP